MAEALALHRHPAPGPATVPLAPEEQTGAHCLSLVPPALTPGPAFSSTPISVLAAAVQSNLVERFGIPKPNCAHRALDDAMTLARVSTPAPPASPVSLYSEGRRQLVEWTTRAPTHWHLNLKPILVSRLQIVPLGFMTHSAYQVRPGKYTGICGKITDSKPESAPPADPVAPRLHCCVRVLLTPHFRRCIPWVPVQSLPSKRRGGG